MNEKTHYINSVNLNLHTNFPYLVLNIEGGTSYPLNPGFHVMHWHEDLQFIYVLQGTIGIKTLSEQKLLKAGEGAFINKNVIHLVDSTLDSVYKSFVFPEYFVSFYFGSPASSLTKNITDNTNITLVALRDKEPWNRDILNFLMELVDLEREKDKLYCYKVLSVLSSLWLVMLQNVRIPVEVAKDVVSARMANFLHYIEEHYAEAITLENLSKSANVSKSECLRCFKSVLQTTPYKYLMDFRLLKASKLLKESSLTIGQIAATTGFGQQSYFGKYFREKMGCSPREYRNLE